MPGSNIANDVISSQGNSPVTGCTKVSIKTARAAVTASKLDASTLDLDDGDDRVYVDGLPDAGPTPSTTGLIVTATLEGFGTKPAVGSTLTFAGETCKCTDSTDDANVGALAKWSASYTSDFTA